MFVGDVNDQIFASPVDVVNVERPPGWTPGGAAHPTHLIARDDVGAHLLPAQAVLEILASLVIRMRRAYRRVLGASVRTEAAPALDFRRAGAIRAAAMLARPLFCRCEPGVPTGPRAGNGGTVLWIKVLPTLGAGGPPRIGLLVGRMTDARTEATLGGFLNDVIGAQEEASALPAFVLRTTQLRAILTRLPAEHGRIPQRRKTSTALGACLGQ